MENWLHKSLFVFAMVIGLKRLINNLYISLGLVQSLF